MTGNWSEPVGFLGLILYIIACAVPAVYIDDGQRAGCMSIRLGSPIGLMTLIWGLIPPFTVAWAANPVWLFGMIGLLLGKDAIARN